MEEGLLLHGWWLHDYWSLPPAPALALALAPVLALLVLDLDHRKSYRNEGAQKYHYRCRFVPLALLQHRYVHTAADGHTAVDATESSSNKHRRHRSHCVDLHLALVLALVLVFELALVLVLFHQWLQLHAWLLLPLPPH